MAEISVELDQASVRSCDAPAVEVVPLVARSDEPVAKAGQPVRDLARGLSSTTPIDISARGFNYNRHFWTWHIARLVCSAM